MYSDGDFALRCFSASRKIYKASDEKKKPVVTEDFASTYLCQLHDTNSNKERNLNWLVVYADDTCNFITITYNE